MDGEANLARLWAAYNDTAASKGARSVAAQGKLEAVLNDIKTIIARRQTTTTHLQTLLSGRRK